MSGSLIRSLGAALFAVLLAFHGQDSLAGGASGGKHKSAKRAVTNTHAGKATRTVRSSTRHGSASRRKSASAHARSKSRPSKVATRRGSSRNVSKAAAVVPARPSIGSAIGLRRVDDPLDLRSSVALLVDASTGARLYEKNADAVLPIASISKLMTAMVVIDSGAPMDEMISITSDDVDTERHSSSRLKVGARLSRAEMLQLALMASENRAANALGRHHPGGMKAFVGAMNEKAHEIGMMDSNFVEPTGLSVANVASGSDLVKLVRSAARYPLLRRYSTASDLTVDTGYRQVRFGNTNRLVSAGWEIGLQKTGYISEAGRCLVMQTRVGGRPVVMVLLDSDGKYSRFGDARRLRSWLEHGGGGVGAPSATVRTMQALAG